MSTLQRSRPSHHCLLRKAKYLKDDQCVNKTSKRFQMEYIDVIYCKLFNCTQFRIVSIHFHTKIVQNQFHLYNFKFN